jgi:HNH endonuclease
MTYVSAHLRKLVIERANQRCEYCLFPQSAALFSFEMEHIIAEKHRGTTEAENLALACPLSNLTRLMSAKLSSDPQQALINEKEWVARIEDCDPIPNVIGGKGDRCEAKQRVRST